VTLDEDWLSEAGSGETEEEESPPQATKKAAKTSANTRCMDPLLASRGSLAAITFFINPPNLQIFCKI
jgi:hypothetical protein